MTWLDDALLISPYRYCLCLSEKRFHRVLRKIGLAERDWPEFLATEHASATTYFFRDQTGGDVAIVTLGNADGRSLAEVHALLVHEAVHLWQAIRERIGEHHPSPEFEAYAVQLLSQRLMEAFAEQRKK